MDLAHQLISVDDLRSGLPIPFVMYHHGHQPVRATEDRLHYHSPFRPDEDPSFDVFRNGDGVQRWGDFAVTGDESQGSVIDLVGKFSGETRTGKIIEQTRNLYNLYLQADDTELAQVSVLGGRDDVAIEIEPAVLDSDMAQDLVSSEEPNVVASLLATRPSITIDTLRTFGVRIQDEQLLVPYPDGKAIRVRNATDKWMRRGSKLSLYYAPGEGPDDYKSRPILLVEGESDTWAAYGVFHREMVVAGLPGTGQVSSNYDRFFFGRDVVLGFDGDAAGRRFSRFWAAKLKDLDCQVSILQIAEGKDLAAYQVDDLSYLMNKRRRALVNTTNLRATKDGYYLGTDDKGELVSNWTLEVAEVLLGAEDHSYRCRVGTSEGKGNELVVLTANDLESTAALSRWCRQFHGAWWGPTSAAQKLVAVIEEQTVYVPATRTVMRPQLVKPGGFVVPGRSFATDVQLDPDSPALSDDTKTSWPAPSVENSNVRTLTRLIDMHQPEVMTPILAWLAIAPLRSLYDQFPQLFVSGASGSGKTTLVEKALPRMSNVHSWSALTSATPFAVANRMGSTNMLPVWFDEFRPGGRVATLDTLRQMMRDAYTATPSIRGGMHDNKSLVDALPTDAPLIISGEDMADEQSHRDRLIRVLVPLDGKGLLPKDSGFDRLWAPTYLDWLATRRPGMRSSYAMTPPKVRPQQYLDMGNLNERQAWNMAILDVGWDLLEEFAQDVYGIDLPVRNWSGVLGMATSDSGDKIGEFLVDIHEMLGDHTAIWTDPQFAFISPSQVLQQAQQMKMDLPFTSSRALQIHLTMNMGGVKIVSGGPIPSAKRIRYVRILRKRIWKDKNSD